MNGMSREEVSEWLLGSWKNEGPSVSLLEGFSGVGKTETARQVFRAWQPPKAMVSVSPEAPEMESVLFDLAAQLETSGCMTLVDHPSGDYKTGLLELLKEDALIIIDDFHELLNPLSREPDKSFLSLAAQVIKSSGNGRLLLISNHSPGHGNWPNSINITTMAPPKLDAAEKILTEMLKSRALEHEISRDSIADVVNWLGRNPRAMQAFVTCLKDDPLEDLIELDPDAWRIKNELVSQRLVAELERQFLQKTIGRLDPNTLIGLESLAVYRKPFTIDAIKCAMPGNIKHERVKDELTSRFLLTRDKRWYQLNPVARQIALALLSIKKKDNTASHGRAATYFRKRADHERTQEHSSLGTNFVEARYHLLMAGRDSEYETLAGSYRDTLLQIYSKNTSIPTNALSREILLKTLAAVLDDDLRGYGPLRSILARLLVERGQPGDAEHALRQSTMATKDSRDVGIWLLRLRLTAQLETSKALAAIAHQALDRLSEGDATRIATRAAEFLSQRRPDGNSQALILLEESINRVSNKSQGPLYTALGYVLHREGRTRDAINILQQGYKNLGSKTTNSYRLFEQSLFLAFQASDKLRIEEVRETISSDPLNRFQIQLCDALRLQIEGKYDQAASIGASSNEYFALSAQSAFSFLSEGDPEKADKIFSSARFSSNSANIWLRGVISLCMGSLEVYSECMREFSREDIEDFDATDRLIWLRVWDHVPNRLGIYPAFYFPRLPQGLTGLEFDIIKNSREYSSLDDIDFSRIRMPSIRIINPSIGNKVESEPFAASLTQEGAESASAREFNGRANVNITNYNGDVINASGESQIFGDVTDRSDHRQYSVSPELISELHDLRSRLLSDVNAKECPEEIENLHKAIEAAEKGDNKSMIGYLARGGKWLLSGASELGFKLAYDFIRRSMEI